MKKGLSLLLSLLMVISIITSVPLTVNAASVDDLTFALNEDGKSYSVIGCKSLVSGSLEIPGTYNGKPVTSIGNYAFYNCDSLTSITIPDSVTSIGEGVFYCCENLTSITIPGSVTSIGDSAFCDCTSLTSITIGDGVTSIGDSAFADTAYYNDSSNWENGVLYIGNHLIEAKTSISGSYEVKAGTKTIADFAFSYCTSLTTITIPDSVTSIGLGAFRSCTSLTSISIPNGVTSIGSQTFYYCRSLTSITIPDSVTSIGNDAFYNCTSLTSITIPDSVTSIGYGVFYDTAYYNDSSNWDNGVLYIGNHLIEAKASISGSYEVEAGTKTIADAAFYDCDSLTAITIPDSVTSIVDYAFSYCNSLKSVTIGESVTSIDNHAFLWCDSLTAINVSSNNQYYTSVDGVLFNKAITKLIQYPVGKTSTSYTILDSVTSIGNSAFNYCTSLTSISIPNGVTSIGSQTFYYCRSLTSITIPDSVTSIGNYAFYNCDSLTSITIPDSVASIGNDAFYNCTSLTSITIPDNVTNIGVYAFGYYYDDFNEVIVPGFVIYGTSGTDAETYANENYITFIEIETACTHEIVKWVEDIDATCTEEGSKHKECTVCGETLEIATIAATGHTKSDWLTDKSATVYSAGKKHKECTECGAVLETATIAQLKCSKPTLSSVSNTTSGVKVTWGKVSGADRYRVYRKTSSSGWTCLNSKVTSTSYTDTTAKSGTTYYYTVRAENEAGLSSYNSTGISIKRLSTPKLSDKENTTSGVKITWGKVTGASGYIVYRKTSGGSWKELGKTTKTYYTDKTAKSGTTYYYTVRAYSGSVKSYYDTTGLKIKHLADPTLNTPTSTKSGVSLKWSKITGAEGYMVYRKTGSGSYSRIATVKGSTKVTYTDKSAKKGKKYTYKVKAYYSKTYSAYSNTKTITDKY